MRFPLIFICILFVSCSQLEISTPDVIKENDYLLGEWKGTGLFLDQDFNSTMGEIPFIISITPDNIAAQIGEANLVNTSIIPAEYGFELRGEIDTPLNNHQNIKKNKVIILLVLPEENRSSISDIDANFHLKNNYTFDFSMKVGGVTLMKG